MNRPLLRYTLSGLCLAVLGVSAGFAQPVPPPRAKAARPKQVGLELRCDRRGGVQAILRTNFPPPGSDFWQRILRTTLHAPLDRVREERSPRGWELHAHADAIFKRSEWTVEGNIDLNPLLALLPGFGVGELSVSVEHPSAGFSECSEGEPGWGVVNTQYSWDAPVTSPSPPVHLAFGYSREQTWRLWPPIVFLLLPIGLCWLRPRWAIKADGDRFEAWFRSWQFHRRLLVALWCFWLVLVFALGSVSLAVFLLCSVFSSGEYVWMALCLLSPPALAALVCKVLSAPAFADVPEVEWTRGRLFKQAVWGQLGAVAIGVCLAYGFHAERADPSTHGGLLGLLAAVGLLVLCLGGYIHSRGAVLNVLPLGELRQRLFELAEQVQVRVRQVYFLPTARWRLLNAIGTTGEFVHITSEVLPHLSRREVDALLALELARLARKHRRSVVRTLISFFLIVVLGAGVGVATAFTGWDWWLTLPIFVVAGVALNWRRRWQHFAPALDRDVLPITGDPEALLTALAKLHRLQLLPLQAGRKPTTFAGPLADWPRLQDLADRAGIPPERLHEILDRPGSGEDRYPQLPDATDTSSDAALVYSRAFKRRALKWQSWTGLLLEILTPALIAYLVQREHWRGAWLVGAYLLGFPLTVLLRRLGVLFMAFRASRALRLGLRDKLASLGMEPERRDALFVGLSPHAEPRTYESFLTWDMGFLQLVGDHLCYLGDRTSFILDSACIQDVYLGPGGPGLWTKRVYIAWRDEQRDVGGTFNLSYTKSRSLWRLGLRLRGSSAADLAKRLRDWLRQPATSDELPPQLRALSGPDFGVVASESLAKLGSLNILHALLILRAPFVIGACFLLGLSFERSAGAGGWYVVGTVALMQVWTVLSFLRYRGKKDDSGDADALTAGGK